MSLANLYFDKPKGLKKFLVKHFAGINWSVYSYIDSFSDRRQFQHLSHPRQTKKQISQ